jgi:hypothetical protein
MLRNMLQNGAFVAFSGANCCKKLIYLDRTVALWTVCFPFLPTGQILGLSAGRKQACNRRTPGRKFPVMHSIAQPAARWLTAG